jgi:hypothetical protein
MRFAFPLAANEIGGVGGFVVKIEHCYCGMRIDRAGRGRKSLGRRWMYFPLRTLAIGQRQWEVTPLAGLSQVAG